MTDEEITGLLFCSDEPCTADVALVFAAANELDLARRTARGVELYRSRFVPKLLVTGGGVLARTHPEARRMAEIARELGVPASDLLVEDRSTNTFENVAFSRALLDRCGLLDQLAVVILVSSEWHMRRVLLTAQAGFPQSVRFVCCPTCEGCDRRNWTESEACRNEVLNEALLLEAFLETGVIRRAPGADELG
jgi:vancomycin permeability regulator SanA